MYRGSPNVSHIKSKEQCLTASVFHLVKGKRFGIFSLFTESLALKRPVLYDAEDHGKILFIGHLDPAVLIRIVASEYISQPLGRNNRHLDLNVH